MTNQDVARYLWEFVRGQITPQDFEQWLYGMPELESMLSPDRYHELISADYSQSEDQRTLRKQICGWLDSSGESCCACLDWNEREKIGMDSEMSDRLEREFETLRERN